MFCSCFELSEGMGNITSHYSSNSVSTPDSSLDADETPKVSHEEDSAPVVQRRAISLVHPPSISSIIHSLEPIHDADNVKDNKWFDENISLKYICSAIFKAYQEYDGIIIIQNSDHWCINKQV